MKSKIKRIYGYMLTQELRVLPADLAYSFTLAIIPILSLVLYFLTSFKLPSSLVQNFIETNVPVNLAELLTPLFDASLTPSSLFTIIIGIIVAANGCNAIIIASNTIYNMENASILRRFIKSLIIMIIVIVLFAFILIVPLFGRSISNLLIKYIPLFANHKDIVNIIYTLLQLPVSLFIMYFIIKLIYVIAPDERILSKYVKKGSMFTTIAWLLVTVTLSYYINHIARYDLVYGNLANIVVLLFWFYILAYIFVIGLCINKDSVEHAIEKTNSIKLEEIRKRIKENQ